MTMGSDAHLNFRCGTELAARLDEVAEKYGMDRSQVLRLIIRDGVGTIERDGLDAVAGESEQPAN